jgi:hypothetical protein
VTLGDRQIGLTLQTKKLNCAGPEEAHPPSLPRCSAFGRGFNIAMATTTRCSSCRATTRLPPRLSTLGCVAVFAAIASACECGANLESGKDYIGHDIPEDGKSSTQPDAESCCEFCRYQAGAILWTYSTGSDYPKQCWCKSQVRARVTCNDLSRSYQAICPGISHESMWCWGVGALLPADC